MLAWLVAGSAHLDRDMFSLMWGPTVAAVSIVLDHAEDMSTVRQALEGLLQAAKLGAYHHVDEVLFSIPKRLFEFRNVTPTREIYTQKRVGTVQMRSYIVEMFLGLPHVCFLYNVGRVVVHKLLLLGLVFFGLAKLGAYHHVD